MRQVSYWCGALAEGVALAWQGPVVGAFWTLVCVVEAWALLLLLEAAELWP